MNKRKPDDEFAKIDLSYFAADGTEVVVYCPESRHAVATQDPLRKSLAGDAILAASSTPGKSRMAAPTIDDASVSASMLSEEPPAKPEPAEQHFTIFYGDTGHSYESIIGPYLAGAREVVVEDP